MKWHIGLREDGNRWEIQIPAMFSEQPLVEKAIQRQHPNATIVYMWHDVENFSLRKKR